MPLYMGTKYIGSTVMPSSVVIGTNLEEFINHVDIPTYIKDTTLELARKIRNVQTDNTITFLAMSDSHYYGAQANSDASASTDGIQTTESNLHAAMAAKVLAYALDFDFMAHLGDAVWGGSTTTSSVLQSQAKDLFDLLSESHKGIPCFHAIGNHDTGIYYHNQMITDGNSGVYTESGEYLYNTFTSLSEDTNTVFGGAENGGYCYRDFSDKKLRVFLLNTSEALVYNQTDKATLGSQRVWFANALLDLNSKSDASEWSFIVLSHYPADYGNTMPLSELLKAYVEGGSITISVENNTTSSVNFNGNNDAKMIAQFHGHVHNFLTSKLHSYATGHAVQYNAWRIGIPNAQYNRENYYTTTPSYPDISFAESKSYNKTVDSAKDTSFVINVINPTEKLVYSFCYGAGYDRVVSYGESEVYSIQSNLTKSALSNTAIAIPAGSPYYSSVYAAEANCGVYTVKVTMGGVDITNDVYAGDEINIPEVTGNVVITVRSVVFGNKVPDSIDTDGNTYNELGYKDGYRLTSSGTEAVTTVANSTLTGFIPFKSGDSLRVEGGAWDTTSGCCNIGLYDSSMNVVQVLNTTTIQIAGFGGGTFDANGNLTWDSSAITNNNTSSGLAWSSTAYIRVGCIAAGENLVVFVESDDTPETTTTYTIAKNLDNVTVGNTVAQVEKGSSYTTTIAPVDGYGEMTVKVTMGGTDITSSAYSDGIISISSVTGNVVITASALQVDDTPTYTNHLLVSTDATGAIYNGTGYKADTYLSGGNDGTRSGIYASGFIPCKKGDTLYFKNCHIQSGQSNHRFAFYDSNKTMVSNAQLTTTQMATAGVWGEVYGSDGYMTQMTIGNFVTTAYMRFCCAYLGKDSIVTVNEPIE